MNKTIYENNHIGDDLINGVYTPEESYIMDTDSKEKDERDLNIEYKELV